MSALKEKQCPPPVSIMEIMHAGRAGQVLSSAMELGIFSGLESGPQSAAGLAALENLNVRGTELVLNVLVGLGILVRQEGKYAFSELGAVYMKPSSPLFMGGFLQQRKTLASAWENLSEVVKTGNPVSQVNRKPDAEAFFPALAASIFPMSYATARMVADELKAESLPSGCRILDIAAGSAVWSIPFAQANSKVAVEAVDFPAVLNVSREFTQRYKVDGQYKFVPGDWREVNLEASVYDLILLGHILHSEGLERSRELIKTCFAALKKGGKLVIAEVIAREDLSGNPNPLMFALNMFILTSQGCVFSAQELGELCREAGFSECSRLNLPMHGDDSPIFLAKK